MHKNITFQWHLFSWHHDKSGTFFARLNACLWWISIKYIPLVIFLVFSSPRDIDLVMKFCFVGTTSPFKANHIICIHGDKAAIWVVSLLFTLVIHLCTLAWMAFGSFQRHQYSCCFICFIFINTFSCIAHSKKVKSFYRSFCFAPYLTVCLPASVVQVSSCSRISAWTRSTRPFHSWSFMRR